MEQDLNKQYFLQQVFVKPNIKLFFDLWYFVGSLGQVVSFGESSTPYADSSIAINGGTTVGSTSITLASSSGVTVGSYLMISELNDASFVTIDGNEGSCTWCDGGMWDGTRVLGQIVEVTSVNGNNVGFVPPLYLNYPSSLLPLATPFDAVAKYGGLEDLQFYMNNTGYTANIRMDGSAYCWVQNIESNFADGDHLQALAAYRGEIRDSYFHDAFLHTSGSTDSDIFIAFKSSGFLIENNVMRRMHVSIMLNWGAAGNVIAYNFCDGDFDENAYNVVMGDLSCHGAHPMFNLWEGNVAASLHPDGIWGSSSHNTAFRNWLRGTTKVCNPLVGRVGNTSDCWWAIQANRAADLDSTLRYYNLVGNVLGSTDLLQLTPYNDGLHLIPMTPIVVSPQTRSYDQVTYGYTFGYGGLSDDGSWSGGSSLPYTTAIIHGDYDFANGSIIWNSSITHNLPPSFYMSSKPSWFGNIAWPPIGPDVTGVQDTHVHYIPSQVCYNLGKMPNCLRNNRFHIKQLLLLYNRFHIKQLLLYNHFHIKQLLLYNRFHIKQLLLLL